MTRRVLAFPWADSPLGPIESWPASLGTAAAICLSSPFQMTIYWGPELITIYNDAERAILGNMHPGALGLPARELLKASWDVLEPQIDAVMSRGKAIWLQDHPLRFDRRGVLEVGYFTYSYSPIPDDDGGVGGVLLVSEETTARVLAERRIETASALATRSMDAASERDACLSAAEALEGRADVVFTLIYLMDERDHACTCVATGGLPDGCRPLRRRVALNGTDEAAAGAFRGLLAAPERGVVLDPSVFVSAKHPGSLPRQAFVASVGRGASDRVSGFVVAGISDDIALDDAYRGFLELVAMGIGRSIAAARARRLERERTRSLAALAEARGRAKERAAREAELQLVLEDLKAARRRVATARDAERRRIERDLHDGTQQRLMAVRLELGMLGGLLPDDRPDVRAELDRLHGELGDALDELRELAHGLYPPLLASDGLYAALVAAARRAPSPVSVMARDVVDLPREVENAVYFCCLEALQNVAKHAGPGARAELRLEVHDDSLRFSVRDDGLGFNGGTRSDGQGLTNLRDRLAAVDGHAEIVSAPGEGTTVLGHIPLH